jgi:sugar O-acyltransferase (sialic acid O-acetyltransferase NeuD family)
LAHKHSIDLGSLPLGPLITVSSLQSLLEVDDAPAEAPPGPYPEEGLIVYGGGGHGKSLIELIRAHGAYEILGVIDDGIQPGSMVLGVKVLGSAALLPRLVEAGLRWGVNAVGGVGDITSRVEVFTRLESAGLACPALVHPRATVEASAQLGDGVQIFPHAYVGSASSVGYGVIVNTQAVVSHDCVLADYANIAPGALLAGGVIIGERVLIGMGVTINLNVTVGARARVGNSAVVKTDVPPGAVVHAGAVWPE